MGKSIGSKITLLVLMVSIISIIILSVVSFTQLTSIGKYSANDSSAALTEVGMDQLLSEAEAMAEASDEKLSQIQEYAVILKNVAENIYQHPGNYTARPAIAPDAKNAGVVVVQQFFDKSYVETDEALWEIGMLANIQDFLEQYGQNNPAVAKGSIYIATETGVIFMADTMSDTHAGDYRFDYAKQRPWYQRAKESGEVGWTDVVVDKSGRGLGIVCSAPVYDAEGNFKAAVGVGAMLIDLEEIVNTKVGETGYSYIINDKGNIVLSGIQNGELAVSQLKVVSNGAGNEISKQESMVDSDSAEISALAGEMVKGESGVTTMKVDGKEVFAAYAPVETLGWSFGAIISTDEVLAPSYQLAERISSTLATAVLLVVIFSVIIIVLVIIAGRIMALKITEPIKLLGKEVANIGNGSFDYSLDIKTGDEIQVLSESFGRMTVELKEYVNNLAAVTAEKERISAELNVATTIQASMLPGGFHTFSARKDFDLYATMTPAKEVGGDFYDFFLVDEDHLALVIADVSGKGIPAALFMVITKTLIKNCVQSGSSPAEVFTKVNDQLCEKNEAEMFVTAWLGILEISTGKMSCVSAGHEYPAIGRSGQDFQLLKDKHGFVLAGMEGMLYREYEIILNHGDRLFVYTDGVPEATNSHNELYGTDRMLAALNSYEESTPSDLLQRLKNDIDCFVGSAPQFDDITMLCLHLSYMQNLTPDSQAQLRRNEEVILNLSNFNDRIEVNANIEELDRLQLFINEMAEKAGANMKELNQIMLAVEEVFVNIAHYAYDKEEGICVVKCKTENEKFFIRFVDSGVPYNPLAKEDPDVTLSAEERTIGGLGIYLTKKVMNYLDYEYKDGKNILTIGKDI